MFCFRRNGNAVYSAAIQAAAQQWNFIVCMQPIDLLRGSGVDALCPENKHRLRKLCASGIVGVALAVPPCSGFSLARLKPGGRLLIRTPDFPAGLLSLSLAAQLRHRLA